jgi:histone acetyltransferase
MKLMIDLKNIIARQLPKMPKEYIVKLLFDRKHEAMVILKNNTKIIGGICFRVFDSQKFAEIVFLAVTGTEQVRGYGTRLMNKFKEEMQRRGMEYLLTYADNYAIGNIPNIFPYPYRLLQEARILENYQDDS